MGIVLRKFASTNEPLYLRALHLETGLNRPTVQGILRRFEEDGWIERTEGPQPEVRRGPERQYYRLTEVGKDVAEQAQDRLSVLAACNEPGQSRTLGGLAD